MLPTIRKNNDNAAMEGKQECKLGGNHKLR